jgi:uncharacterized repeat protein (TIGR03803 family)
MRPQKQFVLPGRAAFYGALLTLLLLASWASAQTYTALHNFDSTKAEPTNPSPLGLFSQGRDGALYSTTAFGGSKKGGAAFRITTAGALTELFGFSLYPAPTAPWSGLTLGLDGNFYGTTTGGGTHISGTVFSVTPAAVQTTLWNFTAGTDEGNPPSAPALGPDGNFYGTTDGIYAGTYGTAYKITPKGVLTTIHPFAFTDGATPYALILGLDGNLYGVTRVGGSKNMGVVFRMSRSGTVKVLHNFTGYPSDGNIPIGTLAQANDGTLYGTTYSGGTKNWGTVFKISPTGTGYQVLHTFDRTININDGIQPLAGLALGTDGNLYGTTGGGGKQNSGSLFKITPAGVYTTLYSFCPVAGCHDGFYPQTALVQHTNGKFYGATESGGFPVTNTGEFFSLDVGLGPFINIVLLSGKAGSTAQILGQGFTGTTSVKFNGVAATFTVVSDTYLTAKVPTTGSTGVITVVTPSKTLTSYRKFKVIPTITAISPLSGPVNTMVTITGTALTGASAVTFGGVKATAFKVDSPTQITAAVPTGAKTGKIAVTTAGGAASSASTFTVTP